MDLEEELEQVAVGRLLGVEDDLDRLGVGAVVAVGRVGDVAAGVADPGRDHAGPLADQVLHAPEAAAGQNRLLGRVGHRSLLAERAGEAGTRMIVLPLRRSVELNAATASSSVATVPMFVRSRPSRTRWTISPSWARSDSTTKSIARPSAGRASGGPTTVTSVPPARTSAAERFWMSPPMTSNTRSTPPTSSSASLLEVDELVRAEVERLLPVGGAPGADDVGAELARELGHHRPDRAGRAVREDALPRLKAAVLEQSLPRGQARDRQARAHREVDVARQRREVARLDGHVLRQRAVAMPVGEAEHPLSHRQPRRAVAQRGDHAGQLVPGDRRRPVAAEAIGPGRRPLQLGRRRSPTHEPGRRRR